MLKIFQNILGLNEMCANPKSEKGAQTANRKMQKNQNLVADFHMLKYIRRFWGIEGWGIAIKKEVMICFGNKVKITRNALIKIDNFL